jgi:pimeloyl-ACP methyl ester carboxylesterase
MTALWIAGGALIVLAVAALAVGVSFYLYIRRNFLEHIIRIFQERPLFIIPRGKPFTDGEEVFFPGPDSVTLHGWYLPASEKRRRGVVLFGLEFGSTCESCVPYCDHLRGAGFDVFAFEPRNQGKSTQVAGYEPLQWVTTFELEDTKAAIAYLRNRSDADPEGIGFFGISKGGSSGLLAAAREPYIRCCITDGSFATHTTMVPYMQRWGNIYSQRQWLLRWLPTWVYAYFGMVAIRKAEIHRGCEFPHLEHEIHRLAPRPWLMIHGGDDNYITPEMARSLFHLAGEPKEAWIVEGAKHNQCLHVAGDEYRRRVGSFLSEHLDAAAEPRAAAVAAPTSAPLGEMVPALPH